MNQIQFKIYNSGRGTFEIGRWIPRTRLNELKWIKKEDEDEYG